MRQRDERLGIQCETLEPGLTLAQSGDLLVLESIKPPEGHLPTNHQQNWHCCCLT